MKIAPLTQTELIAKGGEGEQANLPSLRERAPAFRSEQIVTLYPQERCVGEWAFSQARNEFAKFSICFLFFSVPPTSLTGRDPKLSRGATRVSFITSWRNERDGILETTKNQRSTGERTGKAPLHFKRYRQHFERWTVRGWRYKVTCCLSFKTN